MEISKCLRGMGPVYLNDIFVKQEIKNLIRANQTVDKNRAIGRSVFRYYGSKSCNDMPFEIYNADN